MVWFGGLPLRAILPIMGVLNIVNGRKKGRGASQAKLSDVNLFQSFQYNDLLPLIEMIAQYQKLATVACVGQRRKNTNCRRNAKCVVVRKQVIGGVYANINAVHYLRLNYGSLRLHRVST